MLHKPVTHPHLSYFSSPLLFFFSIMRERERERERGWEFWSSWDMAVMINYLIGFTATFFLVEYFVWYQFGQWPILFLSNFGFSIMLSGWVLFSCLFQILTSCATYSFLENLIYDLLSILVHLSSSSSSSSSLINPSRVPF